MVVVPKRRKRSEIPQAPGAPLLEEVFLEPGAKSLAHLDNDDNDGTADAGASPEDVIYVMTEDGQPVALSAAMLMHHMQEMEWDSDSGSHSGSESDVELPMDLEDEH